MKRDAACTLFGLVVLVAVLGPLALPVSAVESAGTHRPHDFAGTETLEPGNIAPGQPTLAGGEGVLRESGPSVASMALRVILALGFVIGILAAVLVLYRKATRGLGGSRCEHAIALLSRRPLGEKASLALIEVDGERLLVGITPNGISSLLQLGPAEEQAQATHRQERGQAPLEDRGSNGKKRQVGFEERLRQGVERLQGAILAPVGRGHTSPLPSGNIPGESPGAVAAGSGPRGSHVGLSRRLRSPFGLLVVLLLATLAAGAFASAHAASLTLDLDEGTGRIATTLQILLLMTVLSLAPAIVLMMTSFARIIIVLGFVRQALSTQQMPPNQVLVGLALLMSVAVMAPTWEAIHNDAIRPYMDGEIQATEAISRGSQPLRDFMLKHAREKDIALFASMRGQRPESPAEVPFTVLVPAFMLSELRTAFQMGFVIYLPFLIIDMVIASVLMSMGMLMLPPAMISLPFKILLFVLVDGWHLVVRSLLASFAG